MRKKMGRTVSATSLARKTAGFLHLWRRIARAGANRAQGRQRQDGTDDADAFIDDAATKTGKSRRTIAGKPSVATGLF
jgi:hypothetical protein